jgi:nicotinamide-nucleotide amidase
LEKSLEKQAGVLLEQQGLKLAVAESCTGGLISHLITNVAGASNYYLGGVTSYANQVKVGMLGVSPSTIEQHGAVSAETVLEMARGVRKVLGADVGVAVSGIAGPSGGTPQKPVGTVWVGLSSAKDEFARHFLWQGDRLAIKKQSAQAAFSLLIEFLQAA